MPDEERMLAPYDRRAAVAYAHAWAYGRNPAFYDYEQIGGASPTLRPSVSMPAAA